MEMDPEIKKIVFDLVCSFPEIIFPLQLVKFRIVKKEQIENHLAATNGREVLLSEEVLKMDRSAQKFLILHEIFHILLAHIPRMKKRDPRIWNLSTDAIVNKLAEDFLHRILQGSITFDVLRQIDPSIRDDESAESIYQKLIQKFGPGQQGSSAEQSQSRQGQSGTGSGQDQNRPRQDMPNSLDKLVPNPSLTKEDEYKAEVALEKLIEGMKNRGKDPGILEEILILRRRKRRLPRKELREILKRGIIIEDYSQELDIRKWYDWQTFGIFNPRPICSVKRPVIIVIDSSGSTSPWWKSFLEEVVAITRDKTDVYLIQIDAKIQDIRKITTVPTELKLKGGGGTDFKEFFEFEWLKKIRMTRRELKNSLIFFFTDLDAYGVPEICPKEIDREKFYWVLVRKTKIPWGKDIPWYELAREDYYEE